MNIIFIFNISIDKHIWLSIYTRPILFHLTLAAIVFAIICQVAFASNALKSKASDEKRTIFIDGGSTDTAGDIVDVFLYFGTFTLAVLTALAIIGLIYGATDATGTGYGATGFEGDFDSYSWVF